MLAAFSLQVKDCDVITLFFHIPPDKYSPNILNGKCFLMAAFLLLNLCDIIRKTEM